MAVLRRLVDALFTQAGQLRPVSDDLPLTKAKWISWSGDVGGENDVNAALIDFATKLASHSTDGSIRNDLVQLVEFNRYRGVFAAGETYAVNDEIESTDSHFYVRLTAGTEAGNAAAPTATTAAWRKVANGSLESEIIEFHKDTIISGNSMVDLGDLPNPADYEDGDIIFFNGGWQKRYSTHATVPNQFAGTAGFQIRDGASFRGISGPNRLSSYQQFGQFTSNPDGAIGMLVASGSAMQVSIRADLYVSAKGSAFADTDAVYVNIVGNGAEVVRCPYNLTYQSGGHSWYFFDGRPSGARPLNSVSDGDAITFTIDSDSSGTPLLTHNAATGHWVEWTPDSVKALQSAPGVYPSVKEIIQDGDRISWEQDDENRTITPNIDFPPVPDSLRYRAVVSNDVRVTTEKYQIEYGGTSYTVQHSASRVNTFTPAHPNLPDGLDATKVNLYYDGGDHQFNPSGVDFTSESAGTTTRTIKCTLEIAPDPSQERSNNDVLNLVIRGFNRARINGAAQISKRLAFANSQTYPFLIHFNLTYTSAPRGGIQDSLVFTLQSDISRIKIIPKLTYYLPFTGAALPTQRYDQPGTSGHVLLSAISRQEYAQIVPEEINLAGGRMALWEIPSGSSNNEGRNDPTEEDHSDSVRAALGSHGNVFIEATQDLSQIHLTLRQKAEVATSHS